MKYPILIFILSTLACAVKLHKSLTYDINSKRILFASGSQVNESFFLLKKDTCFGIYLERKTKWVVAVDTFYRVNLDSTYKSRKESLRLNPTSITVYSYNHKRGTVVKNEYIVADSNEINLFISSLYYSNRKADSNFKNIDKRKYYFYE